MNSEQEFASESDECLSWKYHVLKLNATTSLNYKVCATFYKFIFVYQLVHTIIYYIKNNIN